jgi:hypothetical protein
MAQAGDLIENQRMTGVRILEIESQQSSLLNRLEKRRKAAKSKDQTNKEISTGTDSDDFENCLNQLKSINQERKLGTLMDQDSLSKF